MSRNKEFYTSKIGEISYNFYGTKMTIVEFTGSKDVMVEFENGYKTKTRYQEFKRGDIKNPFDKRVYGVGYHGVGKYKVSINQKHTKQYNYWYDMLKRCYDKKYNEKHETYNDKTVCEEWHNFQNFAKWYDENYYEVTTDRMELDKDVLIKGNKIYNPDTCVFIPKRINTLFVKCDSKRGDTSIGVDSKNGRYGARCSTVRDGKVVRVNLGWYGSDSEAFNAYKIFKENYIKEVADDYKQFIPTNLYDAMYRYEVEITD